MCLDEDYGYDEESSTSPTDNVNNLKLQAINYLSDGNTALINDELIDDNMFHYNSWMLHCFCVILILQINFK